MTYSRDIRRNALQALYQFDCGASTEDGVVQTSLEGGAGDESDREQGFQLALDIWNAHADADKHISPLTPDWPSHRQPIIDRNVLRMGWYEITTDRTPPKVAINEAVELAREYSTKQSPLFVNGVLDKIFHDHRDGVTPAIDASVDVPLDAPVDVPLDVPLDAPVDVPLDTPADDVAVEPTNETDSETDTPVPAPDANTEL